MPLRNCLIFAPTDQRIDLGSNSLDEKLLSELVRCNKALVLQQLQVDVPPNDRLKPEVLLARAGFGSKDIAQLLGKKQAAVVKTLQRAGK